MAGGTGASPAHSLTLGIGVRLHLALPHEDPSQHPKVELVFALGLGRYHPTGALVAQASVDLRWVWSHWWWCCHVQGSTEGLQHLGSLPCVLPHKSRGGKLRILQTNSLILLEIQAKFMDIFCLPLCCQVTSVKKAPHLTRGETGSSRRSCSLKPGSTPAPHPSGNQPSQKINF